MEKEQGRKGRKGLHSPRVSSINPHFINLRRVLAQVLHMAEYMPFPVLADEITQIGSKAHVRNS